MPRFFESEKMKRKLLFIYMKNGNTWEEQIGSCSVISQKVSLSNILKFFLRYSSVFPKLVRLTRSFYYQLFTIKFEQHGNILTLVTEQSFI